MEKKVLIWIGIIVVVLVVILIVGLLGAQEAGNITHDCNLGLGKRLCWIWEKNQLGEIADVFKR